MTCKDYTACSLNMPHNILICIPCTKNPFRHISRAALHSRRTLEFILNKRLHAHLTKTRFSAKLRASRFCVTAYMWH